MNHGLRGLKKKNEVVLFRIREIREIRGYFSSLVFPTRQVRSVLDMTVKDLQTMFDYGYWANRKLFDVISQLPEEQFTQTVAGSYGSIRNTMVDALSAEWGWLERCGGAKRGAALSATDYPTFASLLEKWEDVEISLREFLGTLRDDDLKRPVEFALGNGPKQTLLLGELMHHAAIHGVHHRGQVSLLLRSLGYVPGNFDILIYYGKGLR